MKKSDSYIIMVILLVVIVLFLVFSRVPLYGDGFGYAFRSAHWMAENDLQPIPSGDGRGEQAMGHPAGFYWLWAVLMRILGNRIWVSHLLPAIATFLSLWGLYLLAREMGGRIVGITASALLLVSPLFITQAFRPLPDIVMVAAICFSFLYYRREKPLAATFFVFMAVMCREQGIFLAAAYCLIEICTGLRNGIKKFLLYASPLLVILFIGLGNLLVNNYFFFGTYLGNTSPLPDFWFIQRFRFFAGHILAEDFRWFLVITALALLSQKLSGKREIQLTTIIIFLLPAILVPQTRFLFLASVLFFSLWLFLRYRVLPEVTILAMVIFSALLILFHVFIVGIAPDPDLNLFRYIIGAYPIVLLLPLLAIKKSGNRKIFIVISVIFSIGTLFHNTKAPYPWQPDVTLRGGLALPFQLRDAIEWSQSRGDTIVLPEHTIDALEYPGLGYVNSPVPARCICPGNPPLEEGTSYTVLMQMENLEGSGMGSNIRHSIPENSEVTLIKSWNDEVFYTHAYVITPDDPVP